MINLFKKILFYIRVGDYSLIYFVIFVISFVIFGYYGIYSGIFAISRKSAILDNYAKLTKDLQEKDSQMISLEQKLKEVQPYAENLSVAIPDSPDLEDFVAEFAVIASQSGFGLSNLAVLKRTDQSVTITVDLVGDLYLLPSFTENLKNLSRLTVMSRILASQKDHDPRTNLILTVYFSK